MSDIDDDSEDVQRIRDALAMSRDEIDAETRRTTPGSCARGVRRCAGPRRCRMRRRRLVSIAAAAAVVLAVVAVGAVIATRGADESTATRSAEHATSATPTAHDDGADAARDTGLRRRHAVGIAR